MKRTIELRVLVTFEDRCIKDHEQNGIEIARDVVTATEHYFGFADVVAEVVAQRTDDSPLVKA